MTINDIANMAMKLEGNLMESDIRTNINASHHEKKHGTTVSGGHSKKGHKHSSSGSSKNTVKHGQHKKSRQK
jgi:hypothetical protein